MAIRNLAYITFCANGGKGSIQSFWPLRRDAVNQEPPVQMSADEFNKIMALHRKVKK